MNNEREKIPSLFSSAVKKIPFHKLEELFFDERNNMFYPQIFYDVINAMSPNQIRCFIVEIQNKTKTYMKHLNIKNVYRILYRRIVSATEYCLDDDEIAENVDTVLENINGIIQTSFDSVHTIVKETIPVIIPNNIKKLCIIMHDGRDRNNYDDIYRLFSQLNHTQLIKLHLENVSFGTKDFASVFNMFPSSLMSLNLTNCNITQRSISFIDEKQCKTFPTMRKLKLSHNSMSSEALKLIKMFVNNNRCIKLIDIRANKISERIIINILNFINNLISESKGNCFTERERLFYKKSRLCEINNKTLCLKIGYNNLSNLCINPLRSLIETCQIYDIHLKLDLRGKSQEFNLNNNEYIHYNSLPILMNSEFQDQISTVPLSLNFTNSYFHNDDDNSSSVVFTSSLSHIDKLSLSSCDITENMIYNILYSFAGSPFSKLEYLDFSGIEFDSNSCCVLVQCLAFKRNLPMLKSLYLPRVPQDGLECVLLVLLLREGIWTPVDAEEYYMTYFVHLICERTNLPCHSHYMSLVTHIIDKWPNLSSYKRYCSLWNKCPLNLNIERQSISSRHASYIGRLIWYGVIKRLSLISCSFASTISSGPNITSHLSTDISKNFFEEKDPNSKLCVFSVECCRTNYSALETFLTWFDWSPSIRAIIISNPYDPFPKQIPTNDKIWLKMCSTISNLQNLNVLSFDGWKISLKDMITLNLIQSAIFNNNIFIISLRNIKKMHVKKAETIETLKLIAENINIKSGEMVVVDLTNSLSGDEKSFTEISKEINNDIMPGRMISINSSKMRPWTKISQELLDEGEEWHFCKLINKKRRLSLILKYLSIIYRNR